MTNEWRARRGQVLRRARHKFDQRYEILEDGVVCGRLRDGRPDCEGVLGLVRHEFPREIEPGLFLHDRSAVVFEPGVVIGADGIYDYNAHARKRLARGQRPEIPKADRLRLPDGAGIEIFNEVILPARRRCPSCGSVGLVTSDVL